jgi:prepilin-type N-terminal cleavage/methylation domain-containing protein
MRATYKNDEVSYSKLGIEASRDRIRTPEERVLATAARRDMRGFTMTELMISLIIMVVMITAAVLRMYPLIQNWRANRAMYEVLGQLRWARQASIAERRDIQVQFIGLNEVKLVRIDQPAGQTVLSDLYLTGNVIYMTVPSMPDTPDAFGNASPIEFAGVSGGPPIMQFQSDGTFVDGNGNPVNGTVFLGIPTVSTSARAVTVLGATGRVRGFGSSGGAWIQ